MNKISKKIVALVTMAAFVLTLVPFAAFGATSANSSFTVKTVDYNTAEVSVTLDANDTGANSNNTCVWVTDKSGAYVTSGVTFSGEGVETFTGWNSSTPIGVLGEISGDNSMVADTAYTMQVSFTNPGEYTIHVGLNKAGNTGAIENLDPIKVAGSSATTVSFETKFAVADASQYGVFKDGVFQTEANVATNTDLTTTFKINDNSGDATADKLDNVCIWAVNTANNQVTELAKVTAVSGATANGTNAKAYKFRNVENDAQVKVQFSVPGDYIIYAGYGSTYSAAKDALLGSSYTTVKVTEDTVVDSMALTNVATKIDDVVGSISLNNVDFDADTNTYTLNLAKYAPTFNYDGIDTITLTGIAKESDKSPAKNQTINFATTKSTVVELKNTTDNTENDGKFSVAFTMSDKSNAVITMTDEASGLEYSVRVIAAKTSAQNIDRTKTGGYVLAGNDSKYGAAAYKDASVTAPVKFTDAVQFAVTDEKGDAVTGDIADVKIDVRSKADGSTIEAGDLALVWDKTNGVYTLGYTGGVTADNYAKDLIPGKYEVRVALASGDNATVTFNVAKFGKVEDMVVDMEAANYFDGQQKPTDGVHAITDEVTLGQKVTVSAKYVDANGLKVNVPATDKLEYGFDGKAVREYNTTDGVFYTAYDTPSNESLLGTAIHVKVFNQANKQLVEQDLTVVDSYNTYSLEFDPTTGPINEDNKVTVKVVDEDGNVAKLTNAAIVSAFVDSKSDENAKVSVEAANNGAVTNGKASLTLYSDRETTADIAVVVKAGSAMYVGNLEYTFGTEDPLANRTVVMTIGSTEYVVNNKIVTGDAAPFVDSNWRTMVPLRALAESFDAEVNWDNDARTVTINYDANTQIVMTIGEETYTVNGEEMTMDTAPVIQGDRTYVPIRFAAQGMGFSVTPLYDSNGLTASVVFQK